MAVIVGNQKGFYIKKPTDAAPVFVGLGPADAPDAQIEQNRQSFLKSFGDKIEFSGDNPADYSPGRSFTQPYTPNTPARPDIVGDTYFDVLLKNIDAQAGENSRITQQGYDTAIADLKRNRQLYDENAERRYGDALTRTNTSVYARGVGDSGIKTGATQTLGIEKDFQTRARDESDRQTRTRLTQSYENSLKSQELANQRTRASLKSPYANYGY